MQVEMRKREQELLSKIKEQQKELDAVKAEKTKVERELTRAEREREDERRQMQEKERSLEMERQRMELESRRSQESDVERRDSYRRPYERVLNREKASPAHLRGRRPPSLNRLRGSRGPSREPSFEEDRDSARSSVKSRSTTYISGGSSNSNNSNNTVKIEIKDAKKSVPPSPAIKKKAPAASSTPARRSLFAPKPRDDLVSCKHCGRNFADDRIEKHEEICLKTAQKAKKRKVFDMTKARVKGTDAAKYVKSSTHLKNMEAKEQKKSDWRKKREEFINNLRAAKEVQKHLANGGSIKDLPPPPPSDTSDYITCPHCSRRFSEGAADRHIPKCKDIKSNKKR